MITKTFRVPMLSHLAALLIAVLAGVIGAGLPPAPALAQSADQGMIDYDAWARLATRVETALENDFTTDETLNQLREQLVEMRTEFTATQAVVADRLTLLREQIASLPPPPEEGESEPDDIAERRAELQATLAEREAPIRAAGEGLAQAEALIRLIDRELRERQANALMSLGPTPLNPATWMAGLDAMVVSWENMRAEVLRAWNDPAKREELRSDLPVTIVCLLLALLLIVRGRHWMERLTMRLLHQSSILRGRVVVAFFVSLSQLVVPFLGLVLLAVAIRLTHLTGTTLDALSVVLIPSGMAFFIARWLSLHIFPIVEDPRLSLNLSAADRRKARGLSLIFGALAGIEMLYGTVLVEETLNSAALASLTYPLVLLCALTMIRFSRVLSRHQPRQVMQDGVAVAASPFFDRMLSLGCRTLLIFGLISPVLGAVGYIAAAAMLTYPPVNSLGVVGTVIVLHRLIIAIYVTIIGDDERAVQGLVPALAGLMLSLAALVPLALIWGARETDMLELWTRFSEGVSFGGARISPASVMWFVVVFCIGYLTTRTFQGALGTSILPKTSLEKGAQKALISGVGYLGITVAALIAFSVAGINLSGLAIVAGALSVGVGFGLQTIVSNFVSGIILLIERPVSEGDWIEVGGNQGIVDRISVRSTVIETFDKSKIIVPNADLISGSVTNYTKSSLTGRLVLNIGVAYGTDTRKVEAILREIVENEPIVVLDPEPGVDFVGFGADALEFRIRAIIRDVGMKLPLATEVNHKIAERFAAEGIEIPYAQRDIWLRNPEALRPASPPPPRPDAPRSAETPETRDSTLGTRTPEAWADQTVETEPDGSPDPEQT